MQVTTWKVKSSREVSIKGYQHQGAGMSTEGRQPRWGCQHQGRGHHQVGVSTRGHEHQGKVSTSGGVSTGGGEVSNIRGFSRRGVITKGFSTRGFSTRKVRIRQSVSTRCVFSTGWLVSTKGRSAPGGASSPGWGPDQKGEKQDVVQYRGGGVSTRKVKCRRVFSTKGYQHHGGDEYQVGSAQVGMSASGEGSAQGRCEYQGL